MNNRIQELRQKIREVTGEEPAFGSSADCPPEIEEAFLESVLAFETAPKRILFELLSETGTDLPRPTRLTEGELTAKLWEVIRALLSRNIVPANTDHLSDRELYTLLWNETLREEFVISPTSTLHLDMTRTGIDDGMLIYLRYYASEEQRELYSELFPELEMPPHVEPPPRRDHLIPDGPPNTGNAST
jgi:hypothetical protein